MRNFLDVAADLKGKAVMESIERPVVIRISEIINEKATKKFEEDLDKAQKTEQTVIPIVIDSYGGQLFSIFSIYSMMRQCKRPVATIVEGKALSGGATLLGLGTIGYRFAAPYSTIMIHEMATGIIGKITDIKNDAKECDRLNKQWLFLLSRHCGHKSNYFLEQLNSVKNTDWYLTPQMAKKHNLIDHIGIPEIGIKIGIKYVFNFPEKNKGANS